MRGWQVWSLGGAVAAGLTTAAYISVVVRQGDTSVGDVLLPWAALMGIGTAAALWSGVSRAASVGRVAAIVATVVLGGVGVLGILTIGLGFLAAATLTAVAAAKATVQPAA